MAKLFKWLMVLLIPLFSLTITSCGGDDKDEPDVPSTEDSEWNTSIISETTDRVVYMHLKSLVLEVSFVDNFSKIEFSYTNLVDARIHQAGKVNDITDITKIPASGWINLPHGTVTELDLFDQSGFLLEVNSGGSVIYYRLFFKYNKNASNEIIGVTASWQGKLN